MKKINLCFFILLILFMQVILADTIIYFFNLSYGLANIIASAINVLLVVLFIRKKWIDIEINFNKWDIVFFIIVIITMAITIIFPDIFWDTYSYHIYLQEEPFADKINDDFFPGRTLTSFVFPIADRIFYMFRHFLGFRLGTLPGYLLLIVIFYQCKRFLKQILKEKVNENQISFFAIFPILTFIILQQIGTYYIDNFSLVLLLEFVYIILYEIEEIFKNKPRLYYLALIVGIAVCIKITNAIYIIIPLIYVLIKNIKYIKEIKWYDYILLIITALLPILPYLVDAIVQTGSPVFPYYNSIFKSEYFAQSNWFDKNFGPKNIIQLFLWPIYIVEHPDKAYEMGLTDMSFAYGYIIVGLYLIYYLYKMIIKIIKKKKIEEIKEIEKIEKNENSMFSYIMILLYFYLVWAKFIIGYTRYAGVIAVLSTMLLIKVIVDCIYNKKIILTVLTSSLLTISAGLGCYQYFYYGSLYNYSLVVQGNLWYNAKIDRNIRTIYKDRQNEKYDIDGVWGVIYDDSAVPLLLNVDDRLVHIEKGLKTGQTEKAEEIYWNNVLNNDIYVPLYNIKFEGKFNYLDKFNFEITEITHVMNDVSFLEGDCTIYIVKVKYNENRTKTNKEIFESLNKQEVEENK